MPDLNLFNPIIQALLYVSTIPCKKSWVTVLIKEDFSVLLRPQNLLDNLTYSTLNRGRWESIGCNAISLKTRGKAQIIFIANFWWVSQPFCMGLQYLITWNFHDTLISRFWGVHISRHFISRFSKILYSRSL